MLWLAPILCFFILFLSLKQSPNSFLGWRGSFLLAATLWGVLVVLGTEILSLFHALTRGPMEAFWILASLTAGSVFWKFLPREKKFMFPPLPHFAREDWVLLGSIFIIVSAIGIGAWIAPPNNWDSMTYHMGRVAHWAQNHTIAHYPTHIMRQLWKAPGTEFAITHFYILAGNDRFANFIQWFSMIGSLMGISLIAHQLGINRWGQLLAALLTATLPMGILQGSSTQNDYVTAFWLICFINFFLFLKSHTAGSGQQKNTFIVILALAASLGLGILTKEITYIYALPFFFWFLLTIFTNHKRDCLKYFILTLLIIIILNMGHYRRNYELYKKIIAPTPDAVKLRTETWSYASLLSNTIRHIGLQLGTPFPAVNAQVDQMIERLHTLLRLELTDPRTTFGEYKFHIANNPFHEDNAGNAVFMILLLACVSVFLTQRFLTKKQIHQDWPPVITKYFMAVTIAFLMFSLLFKWQPWSSRLLLPISILYTPFAAIVLIKAMKKNVAMAVSFFLVLLSLPWVFYNESRPWLGERNIFYAERLQQYFANNFGFIYSYQQAINESEAQQCLDIGLFWSENSWEYPLWALLNGRPQVRIEHINVQNISGQLAYPLGRFEPCAVIDDNSMDGYKILIGENSYILSRKFAHLSVFLRDNDGTLAKKSLLYHFHKMLEYSYKAAALYHRKPGHDMIEPQKLEMLINFKKEALKTAQAFDPKELNSIYPDLGNRVSDLKNGLTLMIEGYKTADEAKYTDGQRLFSAWNAWFSRHKAAIEEKF